MCEFWEKTRELNRSAVGTNKIVLSPLVLPNQSFRDSGTVAVRRGVTVKCAKREGVCPGAIRINSERMRPLAGNAYLTQA